MGAVPRVLRRRPQQEEDEDDQEDYEASSSGRDEFDSDFDLTDSYVGKRGRKKGTKIRKRGRRANKAAPAREAGPRPGRGRRGRKPKVVVDTPAPNKEDVSPAKGQEHALSKREEENGEMSSS